MSRFLKLTKKEKLTLLADIADGFRPLDGHAERLVRNLLDDPDSQVRGEAVACLWSNAHARWIDVLISKARLDPNLDVRTRAISALGRYVFEGSELLYSGEWDDAPGEIEGDATLELYGEDGAGEEEEDLEYAETDMTEADFHRVSDFLFDAAHDDTLSTDERRYAIEALAFLDDPEVDALIDWAYAQNDTRLKVSALFAMGRSGNLHWSDIVLAEMHSANREVQYEAVRAAGELGLHEATEDLIHLARGRGVSKPLRLLAIYSLGEAGDDRAYPVLEELSRARDRDVREAAREAVEEWLMTSAADQFDRDEDETPGGSWHTPPDDSFDPYDKDIWDEALGVFSKN